jgi:hypothetical protein
LSLPLIHCPMSYVVDPLSPCPLSSVPCLSWLFNGLLWQSITFNTYFFARKVIG